MLSWTKSEPKRCITGPTGSNEIAVFHSVVVLFVKNRHLKVVETRRWTLPWCAQQWLCISEVLMTEQLKVLEEYGKGTKMVQLAYANQGWRCTSPTLSEHLCSTRSVWVFKRCSESVWKVHKRHARSTQKVSSGYQAVNHLRDYYSWITSRRQAQFLADLY